MYFWNISRVYQNTHVPYIIHEMHSFASVFMCYHCVFTAEPCTFGTYYMYTKKKHVSYIIHNMHSFASVFMCFYFVFTAETCTFGTFHVFTKIHMCHILYMKCTVLLVFLCVFTVFSLQKHVLLEQFTCILKYTCAIYYT
jgi:hypothetical protein